ncbi:MAG: pilus assembly protein TadG [Proteobacteria bacterium]|nr:pilus assembly protein TadG [Pseudomonadota bacterium]
MGTGRWTTGRSVGAFGKDRRGNVAMLWGLMGAAMLGLLGLAVDFTRAQMIHAQLQNAADGAALAAARGQGLTLDQRTHAARAFYDAEAGSYAASSNFGLQQLPDGTYQVQASAPMAMSLAALVSNHDWTIGVTSQAVQSGVNLEVSLVLDTTGSMAGQKIIDMRNAATNLVNTVVRAQQTPFYSKLALVPFSVGVDVGSYASSVRGNITSGTSITNATWRNGAAKNVTAAVRSGTTITITSAAHGFANGDTVYITGVGGITQLNNKRWVVSGVTLNTYNVTGVSGSTTFTSGGSATKCLTSACEVVVTSNSHGLANGDYAYITGVNGMTQINNAANTAWLVANPTVNTFVLSGTNGPTFSNYTSGGTAYCTRYGCQYLRFTSQTGGTRVFGVTTCASERTGGNAFNDAAPSATYLGMNYSVGSDNPCPTGNTIVPLTTNTTALNAQINALQAANSTAGHIGTAWGWYMLSPNFSYLWPAASQPAAYNAPSTLKIMVLMTDGAYNTSYCNGVISQLSGSGSGSTSNHINCNSANGDSPTQALALCSAMKAQGVIIYTVGFDLQGDQNAISLLTNCATDPSHFYNAATGTDLQSAFQSIANQITQLRISH